MKTTIDMADDLLRRAKDLARRRNSTLRSLLEDGLRRVLDDDGAAGPQAFRLQPVVQAGDGPAEEYAADWARIREAIYATRAAEGGPGDPA